MKKPASPTIKDSALLASGRAVSLPSGRLSRVDFRAGVALAVATACMGASGAFGQPSGAQVIQGQAQLQQQGSTLVVTTQNAAGTNRSVINWQSFSVPAGSTTRFDQPSAQSLSINRVTGNDPSAIYGTLSSNGRLVLVNPAGITVGAGAMVDTAGFTASTLRMTEADALAGRLVFGGDGMGGGPLKVDGQIVARSGDVVLIAPNVQVGTPALVQAPGGATVLAAGQKVELTGRGLEGITLQLQAPADQAVNLGILQGDAVGIFAAQLKHSGVIQATAASIEGGKVVLKGQQLDISGTVDGTTIWAGDGTMELGGSLITPVAGGSLTLGSYSPGAGITITAETSSAGSLTLQDDSALDIADTSGHLVIEGCSSASCSMAVGSITLARGPMRFDQLVTNYNPSDSWAAFRALSVGGRNTTRVQIPAGAIVFTPDLIQRISNGPLTHSGLIQATAASTESGKIVLQAQ